MPPATPLPSMTSSEAYEQVLANSEEASFTLIKKQVAKDLPSASPQQLQSGVEQLVRFYTLCMTAPGRRYAVSDKVDPYWHAHVLHSRRYSSFCSRVFGRYLHHEPLHRDDELAVANANAIYRDTRAAMRDLFGTLEDEWWMPDSAVCLGDFDGSEISMVKS